MARKITIDLEWVAHGYLVLRDRRCRCPVTKGDIHS
jgi:hypothetical protein